MASSKEFNIWNDLSIDDLESMPISMNRERYDLATDIIVRPHINNTYKSITIDNNCILQVMKNEEYINMLRLLNEEKRAIYDDIMYKKKFILMNQFIYFSQEEQELEKHLFSKL